MGFDSPTGDAEIKDIEDGKFRINGAPSLRTDRADGGDRKVIEQVRAK